MFASAIRAAARPLLLALALLPAALPAAAGPIDGWIAALEAESARLAATADNGLPAVGPGPALKRGTAGGRVDRLAARLESRGLLAPGAYTGAYDATIERAVAAFQAAQGLNPDGRAGDGTVQAIDRGPAQARAAVEDTLASMRAVAAEGLHDAVIVNVPSQTMTLIRGEEVALTMRAAVGRPARPTPIIADAVPRIIINPTWTAPPTVIKQDKLPNLRRKGHPGVNGATVYLDGQPVDPTLVDWSTVSPSRLGIVQSPGDHNALGRLKFDLGNGDSIYLHGTNEQDVFTRQNRAISSGCVRLEDPRRLAEEILGRQGWAPERLAKAIATGRTQTVALSERLPVRIVYWTATVEDGTVRIHPDVYRRATHNHIALKTSAPQG